MKKNYTIKSYLKAALTLACVSFAFFVSAQTPVETTVFKDTFNRAASELNGENSPTTYTIVKQLISGSEALDPSPSTQTFGSVLRIPSPATSIGRNGLFGDLSDYASPFKSKLAEMEVDSVVWTFNIRDNRGTPAGFDDSQFGIAAMLLSDAANYASSNGYAIVAYGAAASSRKFRLMKFTGGIDATAKLTTIAEIFSSLSTLGYFSLRAVYVKSTNTWNLYGRNEAAFTDPETGTFTEFQSGVDNTFVNTSMTHFGFMHKYNSTTAAVNMFIDNYVVRTYKSTSGFNQHDAAKLYKAKVIENGLQIEAASAKATLYDLTGAVLKAVNVTGQATINVSHKGLYLLKVELPGNIAVSEKIMIK
ncbi:MAG: T9SS type A sorting domain-containing protein [Paludibacter sp.]|nr:T9SS type A sorting domain-containing protein [Paludibacter sp.]